PPAQGQYQQPPAQGQYQQPPAQAQYQQPAQAQYQQAAASQGFGQGPAQAMGAMGAPNMAGLGGGFERQVPSDVSIGSERLRFIRMTYLHLTAAIFAFAGLSWLLMNNETLIKVVSNPVLKFALGGRWHWLAFMGLFVAVGYAADHLAQRRGSKGIQYLGLGLYVVAEAVIFLPLLYIAQLKGAEIMAKGGGDPHFIRDAAYLTLGLFGALTASVFVTKKDFSFMRSGLMMGGVGASVLVVIAIMGGFNLGIIFSFVMVGLAAGYVLYYTSQILAHYDTDSYVAASLALFSAVALMFWYMIRILMSLRD
ncbi:MAG: US12 family protein, partial [Kofleriaceae bacterium]|nr:US12 family protein [Kofleriaceae bacterium]